MRISDWSSDVCSSDLENLLQQLRHTLPRLGHESSADEPRAQPGGGEIAEAARRQTDHAEVKIEPERRHGLLVRGVGDDARREEGRRPEDAKQSAFSCHTGRARSEEHTSELQSLMRISYAVFCLKKKKHKKHNQT